MQRTKTREETAQLSYLTVTDIQRLLQCSWKKAKKVYSFADEIDRTELGRYRIEDHKVRMTTVCKVAGIPLAALLKQTKSTQQPGN